MKTNFRTVAALIAASAAFTAATPLQAQTPDSKVFVELKDASLYDALEMVFRAVGNPPHSINAMAKSVNIGIHTTEIGTSKVADWETVIRELANKNGFLLRKSGGTYNIEPRPVANPGFPGGPGGFPGGFPGGTPGAPFGGVTTFNNRQVAPPASEETDTVSEALVETRISAQTLPGGRRPNTAGGQSGVSWNPNGRWIPIPLSHSYAGGIAFLFENSYVLTTQDFVIPQVALGDSIFGNFVQRDGADSGDNSGNGGGNNGLNNFGNFGGNNNNTNTNIGGR